MGIEIFRVVEPPTSEKVGELVLKALGNHDKKRSEHLMVSVRVVPENIDIPRTKEEQELSFRIHHTFHPNDEEAIDTIIQGDTYSPPGSIVNMQIARDPEQPATLRLTSA